MRLRGLSVTASAALVAVACAPGESGPADAGTDGGDIVGCTSDPRAEAYAPGMSQLGEAKVFTFVLKSADPSPPATYENTWVLAVEDASGGALQGVTIDSVTPFMPDHGHGTSVPQVTSNPDGTFTIDSLYLFMPGLWQTTIVAGMAADAGGQRDSVVFSFCIQG